MFLSLYTHFTHPQFLYFYVLQFSFPLTRIVSRDWIRLEQAWCCYHTHLLDSPSRPTIYQDGFWLQSQDKSIYKLYLLGVGGSGESGCKYRGTYLVYSAHNHTWILTCFGKVHVDDILYTLEIKAIQIPVFSWSKEELAKRWGCKGGCCFLKIISCRITLLFFTSHIPPRSRRIDWITVVPAFRSVWATNTNYWKKH